MFNVLYIFQYVVIFNEIKNLEENEDWYSCLGI